MDTSIEFEKTAALILAAEDWSDEYKKDDVSFGKLLRAEAKLNRVFLEYFKGLSDRSVRYVNWTLYNIKLAQVKSAVTKATEDIDFQVEVIVTELPDEEDGIVMRASYKPVSEAALAGVTAAEVVYRIPIGASDITKMVDEVATNEIAYLVGKTTNKTGTIIDNPKAKYSINETTRDLIRNSIRTSLNLGENQAEATVRLQSVIKDKTRAAKIASTEAVNAYQGGTYKYASMTGAVGKEWQSLSGACRICLGNMGVGVIGIDAVFPSGHRVPSAHPWDRCGVRYVYPEELELSASTND